MIWLLDADQNGDDSIRHLVEAKAINYVPIPGFQAFEQAVKTLLPLVGPNDLVILDTLASMANSTRGDAKLGTDAQADLWDRRSKYLDGDKNYLTVYSLATDVIMRRLKNIRATGARIITTSHEDEKIDPTDAMKKRAPKLNDALYQSIMAATSDVFRLFEIVTPLLNPDGSERVAQGTRVLQLRKSEDAVAKYHVRPSVSDTIPMYLKLPKTGGLHTLYNEIGKRPTWLHLYGAPGAGKTALSVSEAENPTLQESTS
jgi:hypothetical protein